MLASRSEVVRKTWEFHATPTPLHIYAHKNSTSILSRGVQQAMVQRHARWSLVSPYLLRASTQLEYCWPRFILQLLTWLSRVALQAMAGAPHQYIACKIVPSQHKARGHHSMRYSQPLLRLGLVKLQGQRCRDVCCQIYRQVDRRKFGHAEQFQGCCASSVAKLLSILGTSLWIFQARASSILLIYDDMRV